MTQESINVLGEVISKDEEMEVPAFGKMEVKSTGYETVYDTKTGVPSKIVRGLKNQNLLNVLRKRKPDGSLAFSLKQIVKPVLGKYKCLLHKDDPDREHYDAMGFAVCSKDNLASEYQLRRHMQKRHKTEWEAIEQERQEKEKQEDKDFQRWLVSKAIAPNAVPEPETSTAKAPLYVSDKPEKRRKKKTK